MTDRRDPQEYRHCAEAVARTLLGEPNHRLSSKTELRFGNRGSLAVDLKKGTWFNHETNEGGGVRELVGSELRTDDEAAITQWLQERRFISDFPGFVRISSPSFAIFPNNCRTAACCDRCDL